MKKILLLVIIFSFSIISCVEVTNYISLDKDGNINTSIILTIEKSKLSMLAKKDNIDYGEALLAIEYIIEDNILYELISGGDRKKLKRSINENSISWHINGYIEKDDLEEDPEYYSTILPTEDRDSFTYNITVLNDESDSQYKNIDNSLVGPIKYRLIIDKNYIKNISRCFVQNNIEYKEVAYFDMEDFYIIDFTVNSNIKYARLLIEK